MRARRSTMVGLLAVAVVVAACTGGPPPSPTPGGTSTGPGTEPPATGPPTTPSDVSARGKPNILILLTDDQTFHQFDRSLMPNVFGQLVDQGVRFTRGYVNQSQCCPSRSTILTGLSAHHTGVDANSIQLDRQVPIRPVVARALHSHGYRTALVGKYLNSENCDPRPGWDLWVCATTATEINPTIYAGGVPHQRRGFTADILAGRAAQFLRENQDPDHPFFLYFAPRDPHLPANDPRDQRTVPPYRPPSFNADPHPDTKPAWTRLPPLSPADIDRADRWRRAMTRQLPPLDNAIGTILNALGSRIDDTLVIFMSDNGFMYGEHRMTGKDTGYEESVRVPIVIRYPKLLPPQDHFATDALVSNVDLAPTIMEAAGIPWEGDGRPLLPLVGRRVDSVHEGLLIEWCQASRDPSVCRPGEKNENLNGVETPPFYGVETDRYVYIRYRTGELELYDLQKDPYELVNLAPDPSRAGLVHSMQAKLDALTKPPATPGTTIADGPVGTVKPGPVEFAFFSQERTTGFTCTLSGPGVGGAPTACNSGTADYSPAKPGTYVFTVVARDIRGVSDPTPATRTFTVSA